MLLGYLDVSVQRITDTKFRSRKNILHTPFSLSHRFLQITTKLTNHDYGMKLNMICIKFHKNVKRQTPKICTSEVFKNLKTKFISKSHFPALVTTKQQRGIKGCRGSTVDGAAKSDRKVSVVT